MKVNSSAIKFSTESISKAQFALCKAPEGRLALAFLLGALAFAYSMSNMASYVLSDPDTLMHIASGSWMLGHHLVPTVDPFSHNTVGLKWITHEWLAQIFMAFSYEQGGFYGLRILVASLFSITIIFQSIFLLNRIPVIYAIFLTTLCFVSLLGHHLARPHIFTWPLLIIWITVFLDRVEQKKWMAPYILAPLMILWANLHGSFILGLMTVPFFAIEAFFCAAKEVKIKAIQSWVLFLLLSVMFSLITPYELDGIRFGINMVSAQFTNLIQEWAPASGYNLLPIEYWIVLLLAMGLTGYLRLPIARLLLLLGFIHESLAHVRFISILGLVTPLLIAKPFGDLYFAKYKIKDNSAPYSPLKGKSQWALGIGLCIGILYLTTVIVAKKNQQNLLNSSMAPEAAINFTKQVGISGNVLNSYNMGAYLIFKKIPVFIDGRADLYGPSKIQEYFSMINVENASKLKAALVDHQITWTIFPPNEKIVFFLDGQTEWKKIFEDKYTVIHVRKKMQDVPAPK